MDDSGDRTRRSSPFGVRRAAQVTVLTELFAARFEKPLRPEAAKQWLATADNSAEAVVEVIEEAFTRKGGKIESPFAYIGAILKRRREEGKLTPSPAPHSGSAAGAGAGEEERDNYWITEPTPKTKAALEVYKCNGIRVFGDGLGPLEEDDDD